MQPPSFLLIAALIIHEPAATNGEITVACWNVENLFDTHRDTADSGEYLPTEQQLHIKLGKLAEVVRYLKADVVGLAEVENHGLLRRFTREYLAGEGYDHFMLVEQTDPRGIDVAVISKLPFTGYSFEVPGHTRGILACRFAVRGEPFYVLVNHWKSHIGGGEDVRLACARRTLELVGDVLPSHEGRPVPVLVAGDLNDNDDAASVTTLEKGGLANLLKRLAPQERWSYPWWDSQNKQVHYNSFDHLLANAAMQDGKGVDLVGESARVVRPPFMLRQRKIDGKQYDWVDDSYGEHLGYSDHFPVAARLRVAE